MSGIEQMNTILLVTNLCGFTSAKFNKKLNIYESAQWKSPIIAVHLCFLLTYNIVYCWRGNETILLNFRAIIYGVVVLTVVQISFLTFYTMLINNYFRSNDLVHLLNKLHKILPVESKMTVGNKWKTIIFLVFAFLVDFVLTSLWQFGITDGIRNWLATIILVGFSLIGFWSDIYLILFVNIMMVVQEKFRSLNLLIRESRSEKEVPTLLKAYFEILSLNGAITRALLTPILIWIMWTFMENTMQLYLACDYLINLKNEYEKFPEIAGSLLMLVSVQMKFSAIMWEIEATYKEVNSFFFFLKNQQQ